MYDKISKATQAQPNQIPAKHTNYAPTTNQFQIMVGVTSTNSNTQQQQQNHPHINHKDMRTPPRLYSTGPVDLNGGLITPNDYDARPYIYYFYN